MQDLVALGTGNSRLMKSNISPSTTLSELISMLNNGTFPYDIGPLNAAGISQQGTPLNKSTLLTDAVASMFGFGSDAVPNDLFSILSQSVLYKTGTSGAQIGTLPVGTTIYLNENGSPVPYIIVNQGIPQNSSLYDSSCDGTWVLRQDVYENSSWDADNSNALPGADIFATMAGMLNLYDSRVRNAIQAVKIPYCVGGDSSIVNSGANGLQCNIFPLGVYEVGWTTNTNSRFPVDGAVLSYFQGTDEIDSKRIAYLNGEANTWWLRSVRTSSTNGVWRVLTTGNYSYGGASGSHGIRPAFVLPTSFAVSYQPPGLYDVSDNLLIQLPGVQIETGSYVGTGTYGASNPNTLTFEFEPKVWGVYSHVSHIDNNSYVTLYDKNIFPWGINTEEFEIATNINWTISFDGNKANWYGTNATYQRNSSGIMYYYFAIG